ncbi:MAG: hypothetical protein VB077_15010 [Desulfitobacterium sp.]|nr:hypothetical protein [Desulfitobacterium sp.]
MPARFQFVINLLSFIGPFRGSTPPVNELPLFEFRGVCGNSLGLSVLQVWNVLPYFAVEQGFLQVFIVRFFIIGHLHLWRFWEWSNP